MKEFEHHLAEIVIIPSSGGVLEVMADDELIYSKKATGRHAQGAEVVSAVARRID
ncbi:hypothetical protein BH18ACT15_BH18ACT15_12650 [soil metagenome]